MRELALLTAQARPAPLLAPLASESPEFLAARYLVWRGAARYGMAALISSKVNQFTLLIASLPIAFKKLATLTLVGRVLFSVTARC